VTSVIAGDLGPPFDRPPGDPAAPGGWWLLFEPELHQGSDVIVPDYAGWRRARMPVLPNVAAFEVAPDWVCEVVSPSTGAIDRGRKMRIYAREQVGHLWLIDPIARTLEVYRLEDARWIVANTRTGWTNMGLAPGAARRLAIRQALPFPGGTSGAIYSEHVVEHLAYPGESRRSSGIGGESSRPAEPSRSAFPTLCTRSRPM